MGGTVGGGDDYGPTLLIGLYGLMPLEAGFVGVTESLGWGTAAFFLSGVAPAQEGRAADSIRQRHVAGWNHGAGITTSGIPAAVHIE